MSSKDKEDAPFWRGDALNGHDEFYDSFYRHVLSLLPSATDIRILNLHTAPICRGLEYDPAVEIGFDDDSYNCFVQFNDDDRLPHRGAYFEFEEVLLGGQSDRCEEYVQDMAQGAVLSNKDSDRLRMFWDSLRSRTIAGCRVMRRLGILGSRAYEELLGGPGFMEGTLGPRRSMLTPDVRARIVAATRARYVSVFEHLARLRKATNYTLSLMEIGSYVPTPSILWIECQNEQDSRAYWGFWRATEALTAQCRVSHGRDRAGAGPYDLARDEGIEATPEQDVVTDYVDQIRPELFVSTGRLMRNVGALLAPTWEVKAVGTEEIQWINLISVNFPLWTHVRDDVQHRLKQQGIPTWIWREIETAESSAAELYGG